MPQRFILALVVVGCAACDAGVRASSPPAPPSSGVEGASWRENAIRTLNQGNCDATRSTLHAVRPNEMTEDWFKLKAMSDAACWTRSHSPADKDAAFAAITNGLTRYPDSASLLAEKGALFETFGNTAEALSVYHAARDKAEENLRKKPSSSSDRDVLNRTSRRLHLGLPAPTLSRQAQIEPATDLEDGRPDWQVEASRLIATGMTGNDCAAPIRYLEEHQHRGEAMWFELYSQADVTCWQAHAGERYRQHSLTILEEGERALPNSSRILKSKGERYALFGDFGKARRYYAAAKLAAERNLKGGARPGDEDEQVLNELRLTRRD